MDDGWVQHLTSLLMKEFIDASTSTRWTTTKWSTYKEKNWKKMNIPAGTNLWFLLGWRTFLTKHVLFLKIVCIKFVDTHLGGLNTSVNVQKQHAWNVERVWRLGNEGFLNIIQILVGKPFIFLILEKENLSSQGWDQIRHGKIVKWLGWWLGSTLESLTDAGVDWRQYLDSLNSPRNGAPMEKNIEKKWIYRPVQICDFFLVEEHFWQNTSFSWKLYA